MLGSCYFRKKDFAKSDYHLNLAVQIKNQIKNEGLKLGESSHLEISGKSIQQNIYVQEPVDTFAKKNTVPEILTSPEIKINKNEDILKKSISQKKFDLNTVTENELKNITELNNLDRIIIVNYRKNFGKYSTVEDLKKISGLSGKYNSIKDYFIIASDENIIASKDSTSVFSSEKKADKINSYEFNGDSIQSEHFILSSKISQKLIQERTQYININDSSLKKISEGLKITEFEASMILKYIEKNGPIKHIDELKKIPIIKNKFDGIKNKIVLNK